MSVLNFKEARWHVGHEIECVMYGTQNVSVECVTCGEVIVSYDRKEQTTKGRNNNGGRYTRKAVGPENKKEEAKM